MWDTVNLGLTGFVALFAAMAANWGHDLAYQVHALIIMGLAVWLFVVQVRRLGEPQAPVDTNGYMDDVVRAGVIATALWGVLGFLVGVLIAFQLALEWLVSAEVSDGVLALRIDDSAGPVAPTITQAILVRATDVGADQEVAFHFDGARHVAEVGDLDDGNWNLRLVAVATDGTVFRQRVIVKVAQ